MPFLQFFTVHTKFCVYREMEHLYQLLIKPWKVNNHKKSSKNESFWRDMPSAKMRQLLTCQCVFFTRYVPRRTSDGLGSTTARLGWQEQSLWHYQVVSQLFDKSLVFDSSFHFQGWAVLGASEQHGSRKAYTSWRTSQRWIVVNQEGSCIMYQIK